MKMPRLLCIGAAAVLAGCAHPEERQTSLLTDPVLPAPASSPPPAITLSPEQPVVVYSSDVFSTRESDNAMVRSVRGAIARDPALAESAPGISVGVDDGAVVLTGTVRRQADKEQAEAAARQVPHVRSVDNRLQVATIATASPTETGTVAASRGDGDAQSDVRQRGGVSGSAMKSGDALLELSPTAREGGVAAQYSGPQETNALDRSAVGGVNVEVQGSSASDRTLAQRISQELRSDSSLAAALAHVRVTVGDGRVQLQGNVRNEVQKREVENAVHRATGFSTVENHLRVTSGAEPLPYNP